MNPQQNRQETGLYFVVNSGRKRKINGPGIQNFSTKRRPNPSNGNGELCLPVGQCSSDANMLRKQMSYVADAVINSPRPKLEIQEQSDRITFADDIPTNYLDDAVPVSQPQTVPMCLMTDYTYRPILFDPANSDDNVQLREAVYNANMTIQELLNREKKLRREKLSLKNHMENEMQRVNDLERILREQNIRIKQIIAENVRWTTRYNRLKLLFGEEDLKVALGELAPEFR